MRMWRSGNASPCRGEVPGPIPGIRSRGALDQLAGVTALRPQDVRVRIPRALLVARDQLVVGGGLQNRRQSGSIPLRASMESERARGPASLLTRARPRGVGFEFSALRSRSPLKDG
jgi:hypothetical protein